MSERNIITRTTQKTILPEGEDIFSQLAFTAAIQDEGSGEFVVLRSANNDACIVIDPDEWPAIRDAINGLVASIEEHERRRDGSKEEEK